MILLRQLFKLIKLIHSETSTVQLSAGFVFGMFMGVTPILTLHWFLYFVLLMILRVNIGAAFLGMAAFKVLALLFDPLFHSVGMTLLADTPALTPLWVSLYDAPVLPLTRFNNTIVMGSFVVALIAAVPLYWMSQTAVVKYRHSVVSKIKNSHVARSLMATKIYRLYVKYQELKN